MEQQHRTREKIKLPRGIHVGTYNPPIHREFDPPGWPLCTGWIEGLHRGWIIWTYEDGSAILNTEQDMPEPGVNYGWLVSSNVLLSAQPHGPTKK